MLQHDAWLAAVEGDKTLLAAHYDIVTKVLNQDKIMAFWVRQGTYSDELRALSIDNLEKHCVANGTNNLNHWVRFLRVI